MRISDWSSDVCSSDLVADTRSLLLASDPPRGGRGALAQRVEHGVEQLHLQTFEGRAGPRPRRLTHGPALTKQRPERVAEMHDVADRIRLPRLFALGAVSVLLLSEIGRAAGGEKVC